MLKHDYNNFPYDEKALELLNNTELNEFTSEKINEAIERTSDTAFYKSHCGIYRDLAKLRFGLDIPNGEIARIYNVSIRSIENWFSYMGWKRTSSETQQLAAKKSRDYTKIRRKFKSTMLERFAENGLFGSKVEQYARHKLNNDLAIALPDCEVVVGVNNVSCIDKEIDIPIIIIKRKKIFKYAVEVDGKQFHKEENKLLKDNEKCKEAIKRRYSIFRVKTAAYYNKGEDIIKRSNIDNQISEIISIIKKEVDNDIIELKITNLM